MPWVIEDLAGTKNGVNTDFTISQATSFHSSVIVVHQGNRLEKVAHLPQPEQFQFGISGSSVKLGRAPQSNEDLWTRYFWE